jgi:glycosyltransferase involved in cell wall biosynthesis
MANHFAEQGWDVTVATVSTDFFDRVTGTRDDSLLAAVHPDVRVERVRLPLEHLETDIRRFSSFRTNFPTIHAALYERMSVLDRYSPWVPRLTSQMLRAHRADPFDVVVATGNPWSSFAAAAALHRLTGVPYVLDYRDAWTLDQFSGQPAFPAGDSAYTWERRLMRRAAAVVFVNQAQLDWHADRYPTDASRMMVLPNGFDADLVSAGTYRAPDPDRPLRFGYVGTLTQHYDNDAFWQGWTLAQQHPDVAGATADLYGHIGFFANIAAVQARGLPNPDVPRAAHRGSVPKTALASVYHDLDVLLFLVPGSPFVTTGKIYEYMISGKPIVAVHDPASASAVALGAYPLQVVPAGPTPAAIRDALVEAARLARTATEADQRRAVAYARAFDRRTLLEPFEAAMGELADDRSRRGRRAA